MNIIPLNNQQIDNQPDINSTNFITRAFNRITREATFEEVMRISACSIISASSFSFYIFAREEYPLLTLAYTALCPLELLVSNMLISRWYQPINRTHNLLLNALNNDPRDIREMITGNQGGYLKLGRSRIINIDVNYNKLKELPSNYNYDDTGICIITLEPLEVGDAVCCDKKLYSFKALLNNYKNYNTGKSIPHSRRPIDWNNNVYQLPEYGIKIKTS